MVVKFYGRFADEAQWREIREALYDLRRRFLYDDAIRLPPPRLETYEYASDIVKLSIDGKTPTPGSNYLSGKDVAQVLYTINGLFFDPGEKPRELLVEIMKPHVDPTLMAIGWQIMHNPWPQEGLSIQVAGNLVMDVYIYGRDFDPNESFNERVSHDVSAIYHEIYTEIDRTRKPIRKNAYISGIVKLTIDPPTQAGQALITALQTNNVLMCMENLNRRYGPRMFGTHIRNQRNKALATVSLWIEPDG
ncbi:MAG: hypothetical protein Q9198_004724, partial [Flavoplaca austrocitrina]